MPTPSPSPSISPSPPQLKECPSGKGVEIIIRDIRTGKLEKYCFKLNNIKNGVYDEVIYDSTDNNNNDIYIQSLLDKNDVRKYILTSVRSTDPDVKLVGANDRFNDVQITNGDLELLSSINYIIFIIKSDNPRPNPRPQPVDQTDPNIGMYVGIAIILFILGGGGLFFFFYLKSQTKVISKVASKVTKKIINKGGMFAIGY